MKWIQGIDEAVLVSDSDAVLPDEKKLRMGDNKLLIVSRANGKGRNPRLNLFFNSCTFTFLNFSRPFRVVKISRSTPNNGRG